MKILMIAPTPFFSDRGCHTQILLEVMGLQKRGHDIEVVTYGLGRDMSGVKTIRCWNPPWYKKSGAGPSYTKILLLPVLFLKALKTAFQFQPDLIHAHLHEGAFISLFLKLFFPSTPFVFDLQGSLTGECVQHRFVKEGTLIFRFLQNIEKILLRIFPTITQADKMVKESREIAGDDIAIWNVRDAVDTALFCPGEKDTQLAKKLGIDITVPRFFYLGLLEEYQGATLLFEAFRLLCKKGISAQLVVVGYPNIEKYQDLLTSWGINDRVLLLGKWNYSDLPPLMRLMDIALAPKIALTEGDGKIYNYLAMGLPTIAFDRSVSREILGECGVFARFGDAADLSLQMEKLLYDPERQDNLKALSRARAVGEFSAEAGASRIEQVYFHLMGSRQTITT